MNKNIEKIIGEDFNKFLKLIGLGIIDKEKVTKASINSNYASLIFDFALKAKGLDTDKLTDVIIAT